MKFKGTKLKFLLSFIFLLLIVGCGSSSSIQETDSKYLNVVYAPMSDETSIVPIEKSVVLTFTEILNEETVNNQTVYLLDANNDRTPVQMYVSDKMVTIIPGEYFIADYSYTIVVTTEVEDIQGRSLLEEFRYVYTTISITTLDSDNDGIIDGADVDVDGDGINDNGTDTDGDGIRDIADADIDGDGITDNGIDTDEDGINNATDTDDDNDGTPDTSDAFPTNPNETADTDGDGIGDNSDADINGDGINDNGTDTDGDGINDANDPDIDGDGISNDADAFPTDPTETTDTDGDGIGNNADADADGDGTIDNGKTDSDGDGITDESEQNIFQTDPNIADTDNDGIKDGDEITFGTDPNNADSDEDGIDDNTEILIGSDPLNFASTPDDIDADGLVNDIDNDDDGDGIDDVDEQLNILDNTGQPHLIFGQAQGPYSYNGSDIAAPKEGDKFLYINVYTGVDAIVTIDKMTVGATITELDNTDVFDENFQPRGNYLSESDYIQFNFEFFESTTDMPIPTTQIVLTAIDNDNNEFIVFDDTPAYYLTDENTNLIYYSESGNGIDDVFQDAYKSDGNGAPGSALSDHPSYTITAIYLDTNKFSLRTGSGRSGVAYHSYSFDPAVKANYTTASQYVDIDTDGDGIIDRFDTQ
jgi:hypothetical protein